MPQLPDHPDLDQLRRQARELHRAAQSGDASALGRLRPVSDKVTLSTAQLALAREFGFPSWRRLRDAVEDRRTLFDGPERDAPGPVPLQSPISPVNPQPPPVQPPLSPVHLQPSPVQPPLSAVQSPPVHPHPQPPPAPVQPPPAPVHPQPPPVRSWSEVRDWSAELLRSRTGADVAAWNGRVTATGLGDEESVRAWLAEQGVTGYAQALLVWERFGYPDFLTADSGELIDGQYADRPQLRPILDAVLAAMPALGPVTVQARKTCVSLVSPRRTFAAVQATTKSRVDLGLRLDHTEPAGRLLVAKNIASGSINRRIALSGVDEVDEEVLGWMKRAYDESVAPPGPRRPARRPAPVLGTMAVLIDGFDLPGLSCHPEPDGMVHRSVHVALTGQDQDRPYLDIPGRGGARALEPVPGDAPSARWEVPVTVRRGDEGFDFSGPFVRGARDDRHLGLVWGDVPGDGTLRLFRGAKLRLVDVGPGVIEAAMRPGHRLVARVRLTGPRGNPICARIDPPYIEWLAQPCG
jgi:hypothetical protein